METKRVAIGELEGVALDWAVAKATCPDSFADSCRDDGLPHWSVGWLSKGRPTTDWSQCGPLIERHEVSVEHACGDWGASLWRGSDMVVVEAESPLIAACRAIVASHNPDGYVEVPVELLNKEEGQ